MRTSPSQFFTMVEFMEKYGDLSKPSYVLCSRHLVENKWKELIDVLNSDGTGEIKSMDKWRKVWSDMKNNCKRKSAKIKRVANEQPAQFQLFMTDIEKRVMKIIESQAAYGVGVQEAGCQLDSEAVAQVKPDESHNDVVPMENVGKDCNSPNTSEQSLTFLVPSPDSNIPSAAKINLSPSTDTQPPSSPIALVNEMWRPPPAKREKKNIVSMFLESDRTSREYARERDRANEELERARLRLKSEELRVRQFEIKERVRQRDIELELRAKWLDFMREGPYSNVRSLDRRHKILYRHLRLVSSTRIAVDIRNHLKIFAYYVVKLIFLMCVSSIILLWIGTQRT